MPGAVERCRHSAGSPNYMEDEMNYATALSIAYPLNAAIHRHLAEEERAERKAELLREKADEILGDNAWLNTLEDAYPNLLDYQRVLLVVLLNSKLPQSIETAQKELLVAYRNAARDLADKLLKVEAEQ